MVLASLTAPVSLLPCIQACPTATFTTYWRLREHAVPVGSDPKLQTACQPFLDHLLGTSAEEYKSAGLSHNPELLELGQTKFDQVALTRSNPNPLVPEVEVPDSTAVLAWQADYKRPAVKTDVSRVLRASYEAFVWIDGHAEKFPVLNQPLTPVAAPQQQQQHRQ